MVDRRLIGSWLSGPAQTTREPDDYVGRRLGLPEEGPGSVARFGRRLLALCLDWALCLIVSRGFFGADPWATLGIFAVENAVLVSAAGTTVGHRVFGMAVTRLGGHRVAVWQAVARAVLLSLAIPALIWDRDQRGLHDRFLGTVLLRTR